MTTQTLRNGDGKDLAMQPGETMLVVAVTGSYSASIIAGTGAPSVIATDATGGSYGPYAKGAVVRLRSSALSEIDFDIGTAPVVVSDTPVMASKTLAGRIKLSAGDAANSMLGGGLQVDLPSIAIASRSGYSLNFPNPYSGIGPQLVHPSIVYAPGGFGGYRYWAAYTPYPLANSNYENPCVAVSDDLNNWDSLPSWQPIVQELAQGYNADTHLFFAPDYSRLYLAYRRRGFIPSTNELCLMHTTNGTDWTQPIVVLAGLSSTPQDFASPSIWWNGTGWTMLSHNLDAGSPRPVQRTISLTADPYGQWATPANIAIPVNPARSWWHSGFLRLASGVVIGAMQDNDGTAGAVGNLFIGLSTNDGQSFSIKQAPRAILSSNYRPNVFVDERNVLRLVRGVGLSSCSLFEMHTMALPELAAALVAARISTQSGSVQLATVFCDNFNRADNAASLGVSTSGGSYVVDVGTFGISGNQMYQTVTTNSRALVDSGRFDHVVSGTLSAFGASSQIWIIGGAVDTSNFFRFGFTGSQWQLQCIAGGGTQTDIATGIGIKAGQRASLACYGTRVFAMLDGEIVAEASTTSFSSGTKAGFQGSGPNAPSSRMDDFTVIAA